MRVLTRCFAAACGGPRTPPPPRSCLHASRRWQRQRVCVPAAAPLRSWTNPSPTGHTAKTEVGADDSVTVELWTSAVGGLTENDFIVAAKLDAVSFSDLVVTAKKRTFFI